MCFLFFVVFFFFLDERAYSQHMKKKIVGLFFIFRIGEEEANKKEKWCGFFVERDRGGGIHNWAVPNMHRKKKIKEKRTNEILSMPFIYATLRNIIWYNDYVFVYEK